MHCLLARNTSAKTGRAFLISPGRKRSGNRVNRASRSACSVTDASLSQSKARSQAGEGLPSHIYTLLAATIYVRHQAKLLVLLVQVLCVHADRIDPYVTHS